MNYSTIEQDFIIACLEATTIHEIDQLAFQYADYLDEHRRLYTFLKGARKRIHNLRRELKKNTEIIYLN